MADPDNRRPRPIASSMLQMTPNDEPTPGLNVSPPTTAETPSLGSSLAAWMPKRQDILGTAADMLGAPVDSAAWALKYMGGVPVPGQQQFYQPGLTDFNPNGTWIPSASVPFGSQYFRQAFDKPPPSLQEIYQAMRRHGLF